MSTKIESAPKIKWPATIDEALAAGYVYMCVKKDPCSCGEQLGWFMTPKGAWMCVSKAKDGARILPHYMVCARIKEFRAADKKHRDRTGGPKPVQQKLFL